MTKDKAKNKAKKKAKKKLDKQTLSDVKKEMGEPRRANSVREHDLNHKARRMAQAASEI